MLLFSRFTLIGHSMEPNFQEGDTIFASAFPYFFSSPRRRDVVITEKNGQFLVKRITEVKNQLYFLAGDNSNDSLFIGWVERRKILGKVVWKI